MRSITVILLCFVLALSALTTVQGQVTTSSMSGSVKDGKGQGLVGATIILTHTPTGTVYSSVTRSGGTFDVPNIRAGGPYR